MVRNRQSELLALQRLAARVRGLCIPFLDAAAPTKDADIRAARSFVSRNAERTTKALAGFGMALVDSSELDPTLRVAGAHPLRLLADATSGANCVPVPVTGLHRDRDHMRAAFQIKASTERGTICFRLDGTDVGTASQSYADLLEILGQHSANTADVILLLDLQSVYGMDAEALAAQVTRFIARVAQSDWGAIIVAGYGVPDQINSAVGVRQQGYIRRVEQDVYRLVDRVVDGQTLWFGDYTTVPPTHVELDWWVYSRIMGPKAIYALEDSWFVVRGGPFRTHKDGYHQYRNVAKDIVALDEFSGEDYSWGDEYIYERATDDSSTTGSPGSWIRACVNHHITFTADVHS